MKKEEKKPKNKTYKGRDFYGTGGCMKFDCAWINNPHICKNLCFRFSRYEKQKYLKEYEIKDN